MIMTFFFYCKKSPSSDKTTATAASTLVSLATASFAVTSCISFLSSSLFLNGSSHQALASVFTSEARLADSSLPRRAGNDSDDRFSGWMLHCKVN